MRFLRFKKLINLSQAKYLRYALGEVFFVVIGILLALQVNNLNEERKTRVQEKNVLLALHNEISNNLISLETSLEEKRTILEVNKEKRRISLGIKQLTDGPFKEKIKTLFGKNLSTVCRGLFYCKKDSSIINKNDHEYWNFSHKRHSIFQKESKSYKDFFKGRNEKK